MDSQIIEPLGRNRLIDELLREGLEVAVPTRDRGIDPIAYADLGTIVLSFVAKPIQMKAASKTSFSLDTKYRKFPDLILAYVWNLENAKEAVTYALTYQEALGVAEKMGWTETRSWKENRYYTNNSPGDKLMGFLEPHCMTPEGRWRFKVAGKM